MSRSCIPLWTAFSREDDKKADEQELPEFYPGETGPHEPFVKKGETRQSYTEAIHTTPRTATSVSVTADPWPEIRRYDFLVRTREVTDKEAVAFQE